MICKMQISTWYSSRCQIINNELFNIYHAMILYKKINSKGINYADCLPLAYLEIEWKILF